MATSTRQSQSSEARLLGADILRLWVKGNALHSVGDVDVHFGRGAKRVAALLHGEELAIDVLEALETAGVLVVEVPQEHSESSEEGIAAYLLASLESGLQATRARMAVLAVPTTQATSDDVEEHLLSKDEEAELLESCRDPASQIGGPF